MVIAVIVALVVVVGVVAWKTGAPAPGPSPDEAAKHTGVDSIRQAMAQGPPPGPPEPGGNRRPWGDKPPH